MKNYKFAGAVGLLLLGLLVKWVGQPSLEDRVKNLPAKLQEDFQNRQFHLSPYEVVDLMHNDQIPLVLIDLRSEAHYNLFHLKNAILHQVEDLQTLFQKSLSPETIVVLMSNDEKKAEDAWKYLMAKKGWNLYVLEKGVNGWLEEFSNLSLKKEPFAEEDLKYLLPSALGSRYPFSKPKLNPEKKYTSKIRWKKKIIKPGGGCG